MARIALMDVSDTARVATHIANLIKPGTTLCLSGDLGAGKTTFTQFFAKGLGVTEPVSSPSFALIHEYHSGRMPLYHMDLYRIEETLELDDIGFDEYFTPTSVVVIEWAERVSGFLPEERICLSLKRGQGLDERYLEIDETNLQNQKMIKGLESLGEVIA